MRYYKCDRYKALLMLPPTISKSLATTSKLCWSKLQRDCLQRTLKEAGIFIKQLYILYRNIEMESLESLL
jgi:hypothetical protein